MSKHHRSAAALCLAAGFLNPALAADAGELQQLRQEIDAVKASYEARMLALERRLAALQPDGGTATAAPASTAFTAPVTANAGAAPPAAPPPAEPPAPSYAAEPASASAAAPSSASAFNPAVSVILNGTYANLSHDPATYRLQGFIPSGGDAGPGPRGFSLGESEIGLAASIDPQYSGHLTFSLTGDDRISVEEALFERQGAFDGGTLKAGRFLSAIGYLNSQHAHAWDFVDAPLAYQAFFGGQSKTDGLQLRWLAPTERFVELGAEAGAGNTFPGAGSRNGAGSVALFGHVGDDWGDSASWRAGLSYLRSRATDRSYSDSNAAGQPVTDAYTGSSQTWVLDGIYKWAPGGNATRTNLKLQGEYIQRREDGRLAYDVSGVDASGDYRSAQSGWYLQAVYQFMPLWRAGLRYDRLDSGTPTLGVVNAGAASAADFSLLQTAKPSRGTLMLDYTPSEFSRFRLQLADDKSNPAAGSDRQLFLQYIVSLGAHGAHSF